MRCSKSAGAILYSPAIRWVGLVLWEGPGPIIARGANGFVLFGRQGELEHCPRGSFAVTHSRPPCVSMIERQMARPIPMLSGLVV